MSEGEQTVRVLARSPGRFPILVVELTSGEASGGSAELRTVYLETGYDLSRSKPVGEEWLRDNALGRHSFVEVDPPREMPARALEDYARRELLG